VVNKPSEQGEHQPPAKQTCSSRSPVTFFVTATLWSHDLSSLQHFSEEEEDDERKIIVPGIELFLVHG
jgi:hypothetical protein